MNRVDFMNSGMLTAVSLLLALGCALACWVIVAWRRTPYTFFQFFLYLVNTFFARVLWRTKVSGPLPIAPGKGAVIVSNHRSGIDPLLIQLCTDRIVHWMVAREYFEMFGISIVFKTLESIPVNRGGVDTASTKTAIRMAQSGDVVGLFPEGRVNQTDGFLLPGRPGAALIALKARVPVIPCYVQDAPYDGTALGSFFMSARAKVTVGKPIDLTPYYGRENDKTVLQDLTKRFLIEIAKLAGIHDFQPTLAGRSWKPGQENGGNGNGDAEEATAGAPPVGNSNH
jgi:1-acyl-sn-glycerol-3-phosphate acyltransferase